MAAGVTFKPKRKAGAFVGGELALGEVGLDTTNDVWYHSTDGSTVQVIGGGGGGSGGTVQGADATFDIQATSDGTPDGNARAENSVDLQTQRDSATQVASGTNSVVIGGKFNKATQNLSVVIGGERNLSASVGGVCVGGLNNQVGIFGLASGAYSIGRQYAGRVLSADFLADAVLGSAQIEETVSSARSPGTGVAIELFIAGSTPIKIPEDHSVLFHLQIVARNDQSGIDLVDAWDVKGCISNDGAGDVALEGSLTTVQLVNQSASATSISVTANSANTSLKVTFTDDNIGALWGVVCRCHLTYAFRERPSSSSGSSSSSFSSSSSSGSS